MNKLFEFLKEKGGLGIELILLSLLVCIPMVYNGAPLYYPDSMGYIFWGIMGKVPPERVGIYGFYIRYFSFFNSLWLLVLMQSAVLAWVLRLIMVKIGRIYQVIPRLLIVGFLGLLTSLGFTASMLMPDLFCVTSSIGLVLLVLFPRPLSRIEKAVLIIIILISSFFHASIFLINGLLLSLIVILSLITKSFTIQRQSVVIGYILVVSSYVGIGLIQAKFEGRFVISKSSNAFMVGRFAETGLLQLYLQQTCAAKSSPLCSIKDSLPMKMETFLWKKESFLNRFGGIEDRDGVYGSVVKDIFTNPKLATQFVVAGLKSGARQLLLTEVGDGLKPGKKPQLVYFPSDRADYLSSKQNAGLPIIDFQITHYLALSLLLFLYFQKQNQLEGNLDLRLLGFGILVLLFANAFVNGVFSTPLHRYQARVFWLLAFWLLMRLTPVYSQSKA